MEIRKIDLMRLYAVSETANENGRYDIVPFDFQPDFKPDFNPDFTRPDFNHEFEKEDLNAVLDALVDYIYGGGTYTEVDETADIETCGEFVRIQVGESLIEVPDVLDKVSNDPDTSTTYLLVNRELTEGCWIVAERITSFG